MHVAIAGAGIAGLASAIALAARGFTVELFERAAVLEEIGAGIQLSPNATAVLQRLGVAAGLIDAIVEPEAIELFDARDGARLAGIPLGSAAHGRYGTPYWLIHRADLQAGLLNAARERSAIAIHLDAAVSAIRATEDRVTFTAGGREHRADLLVAADGLHSVVRTEHFGHPGPHPLGSTAWRAMIPAAKAPDTIRLDATRLWLGPGAHLVHYPVRGGDELNVVAISGGARGDTLPKDRFGHQTRRLLDAADKWTPWPLVGVDPKRSWAKDRIVLIGDAAHAMAPSAAQGGAQAIEDAWVLAAALAKRAADPASALRDFERTRRPRVERIASEAARNLAVYDMRGLPAAARNVVLRMLPESRMLSRVDWLFGWTPQ